MKPCPARTSSALPLHGGRDTLISAVHSQRLLSMVPKARLVIGPGAAHNDLRRFTAYSGALADAMQPARTAVNSVSPGAGAALQTGTHPQPR